MPGYVNWDEPLDISKTHMRIIRMHELLAMSQAELAIVLVSEDSSERLLAEKILARELK